MSSVFAENDYGDIFRVDPQHAMNQKSAPNVKHVTQRRRAVWTGPTLSFSRIWMKAFP